MDIGNCALGIYSKVVAQANYCIFLYSQIFNAQSPINIWQCNLYCNIDDQDDQYDYWYAFFESIEKDNAFFKKKRVRDKGVPYMTSTWKEAIRKKRNMQFSLQRIEQPRFWNSKEITGIMLHGKGKKEKISFWFA